jgi:peptide/nickel transport system permease protein
MSGRALWRFVVRRTLMAVALTFATASGVLLLTRLSPGDATSHMAIGGYGAEAVAREKARLGLDRPLTQFYANWLGRAIRLDFGTSFRYERPVLSLVGERAANTAVLAFTAIAIATVTGLPLGVIAGSRRSRLAATTIRALSVLALSLPPLLTSLALAWLAARTGWFPIGGFTTIGADALPFGAWLRDLLWHLTLPAFALGVPLAATLERLQATAIAQATEERFVLGARARGLPWSRILWHDLWRLALAPVVAVYGLAAGQLLSGTLAVELVTAWPGLGRLMFEALGTRDVPLAAGCAAGAALFLAAWTIASDLALAALDPRLRDSLGVTGSDWRTGLDAGANARGRIWGRVDR